MPLNIDIIDITPDYIYTVFLLSIVFAKTFYRDKFKTWTRESVFYSNSLLHISKLPTTYVLIEYKNLTTIHRYHSQNGHIALHLMHCDKIQASNYIYAAKSYLFVI